MAAAAMLRGAAAGALHRRSSLWRALPSGAPLRPRGPPPPPRTSSASPLLSPLPVAATAALRRLCTGGKNESAMESERRTKAELLRHLMREDFAAADRATPDGRSKTEELVGRLRRQQHYGNHNRSADKQLLLTLLVRSGRGEAKLSTDTPRVEHLAQLAQEMYMMLAGFFALFVAVFVGLPALGVLYLIAKLFRRVLAVFAPDRTKTK